MTRGAVRVLLAEDNPINRKVAVHMLEKSGCRVTVAVNGREALEKLATEVFDVVLMDVQMPEMDGLEATRAIRGSDASYRDMPIIAMTAHALKGDREMCLQAGMNDYLSKPIRIQDVLAKIAQWSGRQAGTVTTLAEEADRGNELMPPVDLARALDQTMGDRELLARLKTGIRILELERSLRAANAAIQVLSVTDALTKCFNRTYLNQRLPEEIKRSHRYGRPLSVVICDIDHFKKVNDTWGHPAGDAVLVEFGRALREDVRCDLDWVVRFGGEEFLLILPETDLSGALRMAERIRAAIAAAPVQLERVAIPVTASFGAAELEGESPDPHQAAEELLRRADQALYAAKAAGRNRICAADR